MELEQIRSEIELMRMQIGGPRAEILLLQRTGVATAASAETLLGRMLDKVDALCAERDKLKAESSEEGSGEPLQWFDDSAELLLWIKALAEVLRQATQGFVLSARNQCGDPINMRKRRLAIGALL